jgi:hypothetical protein
MTVRNAADAVLNSDVETIFYVVLLVAGLLALVTIANLIEGT